MSRVAVALAIVAALAVPPAAGAASSPTTPANVTVTGAAEANTLVAVQ